MTFASTIPLLLAWAGAIVSPGPDVLMILQQAAPRSDGESMARGRKGRDGASPRLLGLLAAQGVMTGNLLWMIGAVVGLGALIAIVPAIVPVLKILGGFFLAYLGLSGLWGLRTASRTGPQVKVRRSGPGRAYAKGMATNLSNPKALIFFSALMGPFMSEGYPWWQTGILMAVLVVMGVAWFSTFAWIASSQAVVRWVRRHWFAVEGVTAGLFTLIGVGFVVDGVVGLLR